jgi:hypothetical protein
MGHLKRTSESLCSTRVVRPGEHAGTATPLTRDESRVSLMKGNLGRPSVSKQAPQPADPAGEGLYFSTVSPVSGAAHIACFLPRISGSQLSVKQLVRPRIIRPTRISPGKMRASRCSLPKLT